MNFFQLLVYPVSLLYGLVMLIRNLFFDMGWFRSHVFSLPVISVGNLSFGGTGKTPHIEYLIRLLSPVKSVATLSRGYGRTSKGFVLASKRSAYKYIGDEPLQFARKFEQVKVAVDEDRVNGIRELLTKYPSLEVILLDDAFQHRSVKPGLSILLTDFHRLYPSNHVVPSGTLREFSSGAKRADIIIVTKTPKVFSPITRRRIMEELRPSSHQQLFFSYIRYGDPVAVSPEHESRDPYNSSIILLFTGIANDYPIRDHLNRYCRELEVMKFPDHHPYKLDDLHRIKVRFDSLPTKKKVLFTTEKDLMRLKTPELSTFVRHLPLFYLPIETAFHGDDGPQFDQSILAYVKKHQQNH